MQPADSLAHEVLSLIVGAGGLFTVGLSSTAPLLAGGVYTNVTDVPEVAHGTIARSAAAWDAPAGRSIIPAADVALGTATGTGTAVAWVLYEAGAPVWGGRCKDLNLVTGQPVVLSRQVVRLTVL